MVVIRLARSGAKKRPFYHIVAADRRNPRDGRNIEQIGYFNPVARGAETGLHIKLDRIEYWRSVGAKPSDRVAFLLKKYQKQLLAEKQAAENPAQAPVETPAIDTEKTGEQAAVNTEKTQQEAVQPKEPAQAEQAQQAQAEVQEEAVKTDTAQQKTKTEEKS